MMVEFENSLLCTECGGDCCKKSGCGYLPSDFSSFTKSEIVKALSTGKISISSVLQLRKLKDGKLVVDPLLILRARNRNRDIVDLISLKTPCSMLKEDGCSYDKEHRPSGGVRFIPMPNRECYPLDNQEEVLKQWEPYQGLLGRMVKRFSGMSVDARLREDVTVLFEDVLTENFTDVHPLELQEIFHIVPSLIEAYPDEYINASSRVKDKKRDREKVMIKS